MTDREVATATGDLAEWMLEQINILLAEVRLAASNPANDRVCTYLAADLEAKRRIIAEIVPRMNSEEDWAHSMARSGRRRHSLRHAITHPCVDGSTFNDLR